MNNLDSKKLLKRLKVLYVEDDSSVRNELVSLLSNFFENVFFAEDGKQGLELYLEKKDSIDLIIADINMPNLNGIDMIKKIRESNKDIPVVFVTAYSDNDFLSEAIKLKVFEYIIKPIDIRKLMTVLTELASINYHKFMVEQQNKELKEYKDIISSNNIVIKTDENFNIEYVNELFCEITGYNKTELLGKSIEVLKHPETQENIYNDIKLSVKSKKQFNEKLKNLKKDGSFYIADTTIVSQLNDKGEIIGSLIIQKDETKEVIKRREVQTHLIKDKGEIFIKGKENTVQLQYEINLLKENIEKLKAELREAKNEKDKYIYTVEKYTNENKKLKLELRQIKKEADTIEEKHIMVKKINKENADLKIENKTLNAKLENIELHYKKEVKQVSVNYEVKIDDLEQELSTLKEKLNSVENAEVVAQKLSYWKEKAKAEAKKVEKLEKEILNIGDKDILEKLFGKV